MDLGGSERDDDVPNTIPTTVLSLLAFLTLLTLLHQWLYAPSTFNKSTFW